MSFLNITILNKTTGVEKKASIPKKIVETYISAVSAMTKQKPDKFYNSDDELDKTELNEILYNIIALSTPNIRLNLGEIRKGFPKGDKDTYTIKLSLDKDPILKKY